MATRPHILSLPFELRLQIYELAYDAKYVGSKLVWLNGYHLQLRGNSISYANEPIISGSPYSLLRVCRTLHTELTPMLPAIKDITFHLDNLTLENLQDWLVSMPLDKISSIRKLHISGYGSCHFPQIQARVMCDRSLSLDLTTFESQFRKDNFLSTLAQATGGRYNKQFYKGFFLVRRLDGCVGIPRAESHPRGSIGQCNSVVDQQHAIADLISDEGEVVVTKEGLLKLLDSVMRSQLPGGPGRRRMER